MSEYESKSGLGKIIVYSAKEFLGSSYADYVRRHVSEGFVVLILPDPKLTTTKQLSYFFDDATSEEETMGRFLPRAYEDAEGKKWLGRLLRTIEFD